MTDTPDKTPEELIAWMRETSDKAFPNTNKEASATAAYSPIRQEMARIDAARDRTNKTVEAVARAMCLEGPLDPDGIGANDGPFWMRYVDQARAAIKAHTECQGDLGSVCSGLAEALEVVRPAVDGVVKDMVERVLNVFNEEVKPMLSVKEKT